MSISFQAREQLRAIVTLRWRMFVNGLRTIRGKAELASRVIIFIGFAFGGLGGFAAAAGLAWWFVSENKPEFLAILLWLVFFFWQMFPVMASAFSSNPDSSDLLRFPLTYRSYFTVRLAYGLFDPASALGSMGLVGILLGIGIARPSLLPWAFVVLTTFALFNLVLMQTVFAWLERWLAQRRTREILGVLFVLLIFSFQLIGPLTQRYERSSSPELKHAAEVAAQIQGVLPPGLASDAIAQVSHGEYLPGFTSLLFLAMLTIAIGYLLHLRLRRQFLGENLSEAPARRAVAQVQILQLGWDLPGFSPSVAAVFEKEMRYLARSGPMLLTLVMPIFMLLIFRLGPMSAMRHSGFSTRAPNMAFPAAVAYSLIVLTNLIYNSFGGDGGGVQFFYASPVRFRQILLGKNLVHAVILVANMLLAWIAVSFFYGPPAVEIAIATLAGLLFAAPLNFIAGNLLSIYTPKKRDFATFGRQNATQTTVLASLGMQVIVVGIAGGAYLLARLYHNLWIVTAMFLVLSGISISIYVVMLNRMDAIAINRRETLIAELCRT